LGYTIAFLFSFAWTDAIGNSLHCWLHDVCYTSAMIVFHILIYIV